MQIYFTKMLKVAEELEIKPTVGKETEGKDYVHFSLMILINTSFAGN